MSELDKQLHRLAQEALELEARLKANRDALRELRRTVEEARREREKGKK
jgi:CII-binding regulator of phage lambda lysogenization HflD